MTSRLRRFARGAAASDLEAFADAAFADFRTRGNGRPALPPSDVAMQVFTLDVRP